MSETEKSLEQVEKEQFTRRQALRKFGFGAGLSAFMLLGVDDLARMVGDRMQRMNSDNKVANQLAKEFQSAGIAFAGSPSNPISPSGSISCTLPCNLCAIQYETPCKQHTPTGEAPVTCCQEACQKCCEKKQPNSPFSVCGDTEDEVQGTITLCQQECADLFGSGI